MEEAASLPHIQGFSFSSSLKLCVCVPKELKALLLPWNREEGEGRRVGAAHLCVEFLCQQVVSEPYKL